MYYTGLTGLVKLTKAQYNAIDHDANTKYIVVDGDSVSEYLGDNIIGGAGNSPGFVTGAPLLYGINGVFGGTPLVGVPVLEEEST